MGVQEMRLASNIRKIRMLKDLKQDDIAKRIGITQQKYSKFERGDQEITEDELKDIANALGVDPEVIENFDEKNIFNNTLHDHSQLGNIVTNMHNIYNHFPPELKQLYEDKINLLEEKVKYLNERLSQFEKGNL